MFLLQSEMANRYNNNERKSFKKFYVKDEA